MPPRHSKSEFASYLMPSWFLGRNPKLKSFRLLGMNTELAVRFGRKVRDLIADPVYHEIFPDMTLNRTAKLLVGGNQRGRGILRSGGGAAMTRGADLLIIDDPHSEQDALVHTIHEWYTLARVSVSAWWCYYCPERWSRRI